MSVNSKSPTPIPNENSLSNNFNEDQLNIQTKRTESRASSSRLIRSQSDSSEFSDANDDTTNRKTSEPITKSETPTNENVVKFATPTNENITKSETPTNENVIKPETPTNENVVKSETPTNENVIKPSTSTVKETKPINDDVVQRPSSPKTRHRVSEPKYSIKTTNQRTRSNSPQKSFSYLSPDRFNIRLWKQQQRFIDKQHENNRIYYENRQKLERLAKIAKEPSSYPSICIEQERLRQRHADDYNRKLLRHYIPILQENYSIVKRLANVKGVYNLKQMDEEYKRHTQIVQQDAANRERVRAIETQRRLHLPKLNTKS